MAVDQIGIINSALVKIGAATISSLTETTRQAQLANSIYNYLRDETLREGNWKCAATRAILSPNSTVPTFEWDYTFDLPNDWLRTVAVYDNEDAVDQNQESDRGSGLAWTKEGTTLLSDSSLLYLIYIYRNTDESSWDAAFAEAFAWRLAAELAYALTQSLSLAQDARKNYDRHLSLARSYGSLDGTIRPFVADTWLTARV